jgi:hypothetical protein
VCGTVHIAPHYLAFANELIGGPTQLWKYVADSNIDWGQDDMFVAEYLRAYPNVKQKIDPRPEAGRFIVNVNNINNFYFKEYQWLRKLKKEPVDQIGYSQLVFDVSQTDLENINGENLD